MPYWILRDCQASLAPALTNLFNRCLQECHVPLCLKVANVVPVPKCNNPANVTDFRPISLLPMFSKVLEKIVCSKWLIPCLRDKFGKNQFAYIPGTGKGTVTALTTMYLHILQFLDSQSGAVKVVAVDLSKAFHELTHASILDACISFCLPKNIVCFLSSYLSDRYQRVHFNDLFSTWQSISSGVPQGSVIGPILFCMVMDSLTPLCENSLYFKYADDLTILHFFRDQSDDNLHAEIKNVIDWSKENKLCVNSSKSFVMNVITKKSLMSANVVSYDNFSLSSSVHILGCHLSNDLKWTKHVNHVVKKASRRMYLLLCLKRAGCDAKLLFHVYRSCIRSVLLYSFPVFCNMPQYLKRKLLSVEKRAFKIIESSESDLPTLFSAADRMCEKLFLSVLSDPQHPLRQFFVERGPRRGSLRRDCFLKRPRTTTKRFFNSFIKYCP